MSEGTHPFLSDPLWGKRSGHQETGQTGSTAISMTQTLLMLNDLIGCELDDTPHKTRYPETFAIWGGPCYQKSHPKLSLLSHDLFSTCRDSMLVFVIRTEDIRSRQSTLVYKLVLTTFAVCKTPSRAQMIRMRFTKWYTNARITWFLQSEQ